MRHWKGGGFTGCGEHGTCPVRTGHGGPLLGRSSRASRLTVIRQARGEPVGERSFSFFGRCGQMSKCSTVGKSDGKRGGRGHGWGFRRRHWRAMRRFLAGCVSLTMVLGMGLQQTRAAWFIQTGFPPLPDYVSIGPSWWEVIGEKAERAAFVMDEGERKKIFQHSPNRNAHAR